MTAFFVIFCEAQNTNTGSQLRWVRGRGEAKVKLITLFISFLTAKILHNFFNFSLCTRQAE
jgi:hypothetical protein